MNFRFLMPTCIHFGVNCVADHGEEFSNCGKKAFLVTGKNSARLSGALADVTETLKKIGIDWDIYDQIGENPTFQMVEAAGAAARKYKPDMIIAIGGGSPLDASKAVAVLAVNDMPVIKLYDGKFANPPLPILAIPLTAGTGSEVTQYSILTDDERETKRSFSHPMLFPKVAFCDARYTESLSPHVAADTAVDALSHSVEGYLSKRSTPASDALAIEAIQAFGKVKEDLKSGSMSLPVRETLLYVSLLGGMVIAQTGTTTVHALGYSLTYFHHIPHGRANGLLLGEYLRFNQPAAGGKIAQVLQALGLGSVEEVKELMQALLPSNEVLTEDQLEKYAVIAGKTTNVVNTPRQPSHDELKGLLRASMPIKP
jgi:alcohol dehydrogenase class IV